MAGTNPTNVKETIQKMFDEAEKMSCNQLRQRARTARIEEKWLQAAIFGITCAVEFKDYSWFKVSERMIARIPSKADAFECYEHLVKAYAVLDHMEDAFHIFFKMAEVTKSPSKKVELLDRARRLYEDECMNTHPNPEEILQGRIILKKSANHEKMILGVCKKFLDETSFFPEMARKHLQYIVDHPEYSPELRDVYIRCAIMEWIANSITGPVDNLKESFGSMTTISLKRLMGEQVFSILKSEQFEPIFAIMETLHQIWTEGTISSDHVKNLSLVVEKSNLGERMHFLSMKAEDLHDDFALDEKLSSDSEAAAFQEFSTTEKSYFEKILEYIDAHTEDKNTTENE